MDHRLVELGLALPEAFKLRNGYGKWPIREIMRDKIPNQIRLARYKRGFDISLHSLLKAGLGQSIRSTLNSNKQCSNEFLKRSIKIESAFSDKQLSQSQRAMTEAITLLWLNKVYI
jgi:asparagine synthase (glutamine-hydrolysing)